MEEIVQKTILDLRHILLGYTVILQNINAPAKCVGKEHILITVKKELNKSKTIVRSCNWNKIRSATRILLREGLVNVKFL